jgi:aminomethyltransferase
VGTLLSGATAPDEPLTFVRGSIADAGVTVVATDDPTGETGYEVVTAAADAPAVLESLLARGAPTVPVGYHTWDTLTLEAGTPLFETELAGRIPNVAGLRNALDFDKGCYVGQEVVSRVENQGRPSRRLVGLTLDGLADELSAIDGDADPDGIADRLPDAGAAVFDGDAAIGEVTRAAVGPGVDRPIAFALVGFDDAPGAVTVRVDGEETAATRTDLPFVDGSARSGRLPTYPGD